MSFNLQSAICGLQSAVCSLQSAVCSLQSTACSLQSANVIHRFQSRPTVEIPGRARCEEHLEIGVPRLIPDAELFMYLLF